MTEGKFGLPLHRLQFNDLGPFEYIGMGMSRIAWKYGDYVFKLAKANSGLIQNKNEYDFYQKNNEASVAKVFGLYEIDDTENMLIVQEYCQPIEKFTIELIRMTIRELDLFPSTESTRTALLELIESLDFYNDDEDLALLQSIYYESFDNLIEYSEIDSIPVSAIQEALEDMLHYSVLNEEEISDLCYSNVGVSNGDEFKFVAIDCGFGSNVAEILKDDETYIIDSDNTIFTEAIK